MTTLLSILELFLLLLLDQKLITINISAAAIYFLILTEVSSGVVRSNCFSLLLTSWQNSWSRLITLFRLYSFPRRRQNEVVGADGSTCTVWHIVIPNSGDGFFPLAYSCLSGSPLPRDLCRVTFLSPFPFSDHLCYISYRANFYHCLQLLFCEKWKAVLITIVILHFHL